MLLRVLRHGHSLLGDEREISIMGRVMIHAAWATLLISGNSKELSEAMFSIAGALESADAGQVELFSRILEKSEDEVRDMLFAETWFSAKEAVEAGLATARMNEPKDGNSKALFKNELEYCYQDFKQRGSCRQI